MADQARIDRILNRALELTASGGVDWHIDAEVPAMYFASLGAAQLRIRSDDADDIAPFSFEIYMPSVDEVVEKLKSEPLASPPTVQARAAPPTVQAQAARVRNRKLKNLYNAAKRTALGIDAVMDDLERQLGLESPPKDR